VRRAGSETNSGVAIQRQLRKFFLTGSRYRDVLNILFYKKLPSKNDWPSSPETKRRTILKSLSEREVPRKCVKRLERVRRFLRRGPLVQLLSKPVGAHRRARGDVRYCYKSWGTVV
jgi:hypothetical protein